MSAAERDQIRRARAYVTAARTSGKADDHAVGLALDILTAGATAAGVTMEYALNGWDPDPRIDTPHSHRTRAESLADLDERERYAAVRIAHRMRARLGASSDEETELEIWSVAHDRAIADTDAEHGKEAK